MKNVLIVGGGIAGSALAILLGRQGAKVELLEKRTFPREKPCGEGLMPAGVAILDQLGLLEQVGGVRFQGVVYHSDELRIEGRFPQVEGFPRFGLAQRRYRLDHVLFEAAAATPGVYARTGVCVDRLLDENGCISGVVADDEELRADLIVAADGAQSRVRSLLGWNVPPAHKRVGLRAHFRLAEGRPQSPWVNVFLLQGCELYVTPLPGAEVGVAVLTTGAALGSLPEQAFDRWRRSSRFLTDYLDGAEQTTEVMATSPLGHHVRRGSSPGVVLLGDAAGSCDPITGGGMAQALLCAKLLARYLEDREGRDWDWLAAFERDRRALLRDYQQLTRLLLSVTRHPGLTHFSLHALRRLPGVLSHLVGVAGGARAMLGGRSATERLLPELHKAS
jgi:2-polyprenyl-6-methoxyphenol hydroxylase-like FAD-dependent oxidoreductase